MINQKNLTALGFTLSGEYRRYTRYTKDGVVIDVAKYKTGGEYLSSVIIDGQQKEVKSLDELNKLLTK